MSDSLPPPPPPPNVPAAPDPAAQPAPQPPPPSAPPPPAAPPPPPPLQAVVQARALFSQLDPTGVRPTLIVAALVLALFFGPQLVNALIPVRGVGPGGPGPGGPGPQPTVGPGPTIGPGPITTPLPPGSTLTIGPLRVPLENGWVPQEVPGSQSIIVRLVKGSVAIDVLGATLQGSADAATVYNAFMTSLAESGATGFGATPPNAITLGQGIPAARGTYTGVFGQSQIEGEVTTLVVSADSGFIFDVWGSAGTLRALLPEAQRMIDNLQVQ